MKFLKYQFVSNVYRYMRGNSLMSFHHEVSRRVLWSRLPVNRYMVEVSAPTSFDSNGSRKLVVEKNVKRSGKFIFEKKFFAILKGVDPVSQRTQSRIGSLGIIVFRKMNKFHLLKKFLIFPKLFRPKHTYLVMKIFTKSIFFSDSR